jgi:hypothetical protein
MPVHQFMGSTRSGCDCAGGTNNSAEKRKGNKRLIWKLRVEGLVFRRSDGRLKDI